MGLSLSTFENTLGTWVWGWLKSARWHIEDTLCMHVGVVWLGRLCHSEHANDPELLLLSLKHLCQVITTSLGPTGCDWCWDVIYVFLAAHYSRWLLSCFPSPEQSISSLPVIKSKLWWVLCMQVTFLGLTLSCSCCFCQANHWNSSQWKDPRGKFVLEPFQVRSDDTPFRSSWHQSVRTGLQKL